MAHLPRQQKHKRTRIGDDDDDYGDGDGDNVDSQMESENELVNFNRLIEVKQDLSEIQKSITDLENSKKSCLQSGSNALFYDEHLIKKREELKSVKEEQKMFFHRFDFKVKASRKLLFCVVDVFYPVLVEVPISVNDIIEATIPSAVLPPFLTPHSTENRSTNGEFVRVGGRPDTYVFSFETTVPAHQAKLGHHFLYGTKLMPNMVLSPDCRVEDGYAKYVVPKRLVSESDAKEVIIAKMRRNQSRITDTVEFASPAAMFSAILTNISQLDVSDPSDNVDCQILYVAPLENTLNRHLETWVRRWYGDNFDITGNVALLEQSKLTIHQMSRPDFTLIPKFNAFSAISVTIDEDEYDEDEYDELIGVAGECKMKVNNKAQALANMVSVAGLLAYRALQQEKKFYMIKVYGLMCKYDNASARLLCLTLNFRTRQSDITEFTQQNDIGYQFAAAISLVQQYTSPA